jgi:L-asparaginase
MRDLPKIQVIVLGGTITMMPQPDGGVAPKLSGEDLVNAVPQLSELCELAVETPFLMPGASLTLHQVCEIAESAKEAARSGFQGIIVVQGTDTIEEVAFALDVLLDLPIPVVVTGAMRHPSTAGADGAANLLASAVVACSDQARDIGVVVVLNDEVHLARYVEKRHSNSTSAFESPVAGPIGEVVEGDFRPLWSLPDRGMSLRRRLSGFADVALVSVSLGDDGRMLELASASFFKGIVIESLGGGHLPERMLTAVDAISLKVPLVLAKRVSGGPVLRRTYSFKGSERDLIKKGLIPAGRLSAKKARLLLAALVHASASHQEIEASFDAYG